MRNRNFIPLIFRLVFTSIVLAACGHQYSMRQTVIQNTPIDTRVFQASVTVPPTLPVATSTSTILSTADISSSETVTAESSKTMPDQFIYFFDTDIWQYGVINAPKGTAYPTKLLPLGVGQAYDVGFSNFSDRLWFLKTDYSDDYRKIPEQQLFISDLRGQELTLVYTTTNEIWPMKTTDLGWTPDDQHLIIQTSYLPEDALIYHVQTGHLEAWPYDCNRLAFSPRSSKLALWCGNVSADDTYAVIEWGGEIWLSKSAPQETFVQTGNLAWSMGARLLAFSDDTQPDGNLYLMDQAGNLIQTIPGIMAWRHPIYKDVWGTSLSWSANGKRLLIFAPGSSEKPCMPDEYNPLILGPDNNPPCWHVYDVERGQMIWDLPDAIGEGESYESRIFEHAALSRDGRYLALSVNGVDNLQRGVWVVDLETSQRVVDYTYLVTSDLCWGPVFEADFTPGAK
jgi:hypothetical protein